MTMPTATWKQRRWGCPNRYHVIDDHGYGLCCALYDEPEVAPPESTEGVCKRALRMLRREGVVMPDEVQP